MHIEIERLLDELAERCMKKNAPPFDSKLIYELSMMTREEVVTAMDTPRISTGELTE